MISSNDRDRRVRRGLVALWLATAVLAASGCTGDHAPAGVGPVREPLAAGLAVSRLEAAPGDTVSLQPLVWRPGGGPLAGVQGSVAYDPAAVRYLGQPLAGEAFVLVNVADTAAGVLRVASLRLAGLDSATADLRFEVRRAGWRDRLGYRLDEAATPDGIAFRRAATVPLQERPVGPGTPAVRTLEEWWRYFGLVERPAARLAGQGTVYGDVTLNGIIDVLDASAVANLAVGNRALLTEASRDYVIAGDVAPANLPGLGEATDPIPPGREADGGYQISVLDAVEVNNEAVGNDRPIAGEAIPGRGPRPGAAVLSGILTADRTLFRDTVYELRGNFIVGPGVTLSAQPGTRIEGDAATRGALVVARAGNLSLRGTRIEPIEMTCKGAARVPGCWGGVVLNGLALLNHRDPGTTGFCPEKVSIGSTELYGGCLVEDTSGAMEYVRIEYAGMSAGSGPVGGLNLLGVGSGTTLNHIQVHGSLGDGIYISGGNVNLRQVLLTANAGVALHWDHGWGGNGIGGAVQFLQVQQLPGSGDALLGSTLAGAPNTLPRSEPDLYHVTVLGAGPGTGPGRGYVLQDGSSGTLRDAIILGTGADGFDIEGPDACAQFGAGMAFFDHNIVFGNAPDYATDADCMDEVAYATTPALGNRVVDPQLIAGGSTLTPDSRPLAGSPAGTGAVAPPSNLFFDVTPTWIGAVAPANATRTNVPWYAGWSRGWSGATP